MIDPKKELFKWGPIDGQILYIEFYTDYLVSYQTRLKRSWPDMLNHIKDNKVFIVLENHKLREYGVQLFNEYILDKKKCKKAYDHWRKIAEKIVDWCNKHKSSDLTKLSDQELFQQLSSFFKIYEEFWVYGFIPEVANWGGEKILMEYINKNYPKNFNEIFEALTAPEELSFYQVEEKDLLTGDLKEHAKKYFWIRNSYGGVQVITVEMFEERLKQLSSQEIEEKINEIDNFLKRTKKKKEKVRERFKLTKETMILASRLSFSIWWQDLRKKYIFMALHVIFHFAREVAKRNEISHSDIELYNPKELLTLAETGGKLNLTARKKGYMAYYHEKENSISYEYGDRANEIISKYADVKIDKNVEEITGLVTSKGKVTGNVRILSGSRHFDSMQEGEVLVTSMTSPEFIVAMRKASAIITDEGGITCHAAIVSRELGIPCIVGTKVATRIFKDGDLVEVDADKGIVKKCKK